MNIEKMKAFAQAQRESEESTEIRPAPKPAEPEYQPEAIYIPIEDDEPTEMPDDGFAAVSNEEEPGNYIGTVDIIRAAERSGTGLSAHAGQRCSQYR